MSDVIFWVILGVILCVAEILTPSFFIFWFGLGAFVAALSAIWLGTLLQILIFALSSAIFVILSRPIAKKISGEEPRKIHVDEIVGKEALVLERIDNFKGTGVVKVNGDTWRAVSVDDSIVEEGEKVRILKVEGAHLVVERVKEA